MARPPRASNARLKLIVTHGGKEYDLRVTGELTIEIAAAPAVKS